MINKRSGNIGKPDAEGIKITGIPTKFAKGTKNSSSETADISEI